MAMPISVRPIDRFLLVGSVQQTPNTSSARLMGHSDLWLSVMKVRAGGPDHRQKAPPLPGGPTAKRSMPCPTIQPTRATRQTRRFRPELSHGTRAISNPGQPFSHKFDTRGTYRHFCTPHEMAGMTATIVVTCSQLETRGPYPTSLPTQPFLITWSTASVRVDTLSVRNTRVRCDCTVRALTPSSAAISLLPSPRGAAREA
jgi:Copper binding proteins, plastocyanin/azurin family